MEGINPGNPAKNKLFFGAITIEVPHQNKPGQDKKERHSDPTGSGKGGKEGKISPTRTHMPTGYIKRGEKSEACQ
jgi:hypothetical protein